jgi:hypothetical protein
MQLIILSHEPFRHKMRDDYCMDQFANDGFTVSYWCVQKLLGYSSKTNYINQETAEGVTYFDDKKRFISELLKLDSNSIICLEIWFNRDSFDIFRTISQKKLQIFRIDNYRNQPILTSHKDKFVRSIKQGDFKKITGALKTQVTARFFNFMCKIQNIRQSPLTFIPGSRSESEFSIPGNKVVSITHFDYYSHLHIENTPSLIEEKYIVFIDIFLPYHPDIIRQGSSSISADKYFPLLNKLFDSLEQETGFKVIIASHPKAKYTNEFAGRTCISGATARLVAHAEAVLSHHSTAINFAVLCNKKIGLLFADAFVNATHDNYVLRNAYDSMRGYRDVLNCTMIDMDRAFLFKDFKQIDENQYKKFIKDFLLAREFPKNNYEIISQELKINK